MIAESTGWWWPFNDLIVMTERPSTIHWSNGRVDYVDYPDGFQVTELNLLDVLAIKTS